MTSTLPPRRLISPVTRLLFLFQKRIQTNSKELIKALPYWLVVWVIKLQPMGSLHKVRVMKNVFQLHGVIIQQLNALHLSQVLMTNTCTSGETLLGSDAFCNDEFWMRDERLFRQLIANFDNICTSSKMLINWVGNHQRLFTGMIFLRIFQRASNNIAVWIQILSRTVIFYWLKCKI